MGLGGDDNNTAGPPEETAEIATENGTGDPSSTSGKAKTTLGWDIRSMRYYFCFILYLVTQSRSITSTYLVSQYNVKPPGYCFACI